MMTRSPTEARGTNYLSMLSCHASTEPPQPAGGLYVGGFEDHYVRTPGAGIDVLVCVRRLSRST